MRPPNVANLLAARADPSGTLGSPLRWRLLKAALVQIEERAPRLDGGLWEAHATVLAARDE